MIIDDFSNPKRKLTVSEASAANDYFTRRKSEEDRIAGVKAPAKNKKNPANTDYAKKRKQQDIEESRPFRGTGGAFNRGDDERHDLDPTDWYKVKDGKMFRVSIYPRQVAQAEREGYSRTQAEAKAAADSQGVAEGLGDHRALGKHHEEMTDRELRKVGNKLPDAWDAAVFRRKLASHPKYAQALKHYDKSEYHFGKAARQGVAEGSESGPVEAYGYRYNNRDQRIVWRKIFPSGEAAYAWADRNNATVLGTRSTEQSLKENAEDLHIGDPVIITGNGIEFEGATGEIIDFGQQHRFVVVNLYNHGRHSFHSSDVSFNEYAGSNDEEARMYDAGEFGDDDRDEMDEARTSAAQRLSNAWDRQRAKSDASLRRTPSSIPKTVDKERIIRDIATSNASPEHKKVAIDAVMKTMSESRAGRRALMATMLNSR
jgi:hypothetical protein